MTVADWLDLLEDGRVLLLLLLLLLLFDLRALAAEPPPFLLLAALPLLKVFDLGRFPLVVAAVPFLTTGAPLPGRLLEE